MKTLSWLSLIVGIMCASALTVPAVEPIKLDADVQDAIQLFQKTDPKMQHLFQTAYGYVVFPSVGKGAAGIGAAAGRGLVFEQGKPVGEAEMTQVTVGAQLGGQSYAEVILFESQKALDEFKAGKTTLAAGLSAVAAADGASAEAKYEHGVLVYTMAKSGLMFQASVGGQHFKFTPSVASSPASQSATRSTPTGDGAPPPTSSQPPPPQPAK